MRAGSIPAPHNLLLRPAISFSLSSSPKPRGVSNPPPSFAKGTSMSNETIKSERVVLPTQTPLVWPDPRCLAGQAQYETRPPFDPIIASADLIAGVIVGACDKTVKWVDNVFCQPNPRRVCLVILVSPTAPTREEHLISLKLLQAQFTGPEKQLEVRVLPVARVFGSDFERPVLPPTTFLAHDSSAAKSWLGIGSVGDFGRDEIQPASFNAFFQPDDAMRDTWRRWFQYIFSSAAPLTTETVRIPHLAPVQGDPAAAEMWAAFESVCRGEPSKLKVDVKTGEVTVEAGGAKVKPWDDGKTALDPLAQLLQQVYARGWLVTVDETTRIKPLAIPVKATLLGQQSERTLGALTQKQSFSLQVLDEMVGKEVEKCRRVNDIVDLLSYLLSMGSHWLPEGAKVLFEKELEARNEKGLASLKAALGGNDVTQFVAKRKKKIQDDLDAMYNQLGQGKSVPADKLAAVFTEVQDRLTAALSARITPRAVYNKIAPPDLTAKAPDESWTQPLSLLLRSARLMRDSLTDSYFPLRFTSLAFGENEFQASMNVFDASILKTPDPQRAKEELALLDKIESGSEKPKDKCAALWRIITGEIRS
jgi:hypothetical protein